MHRLIKLIAALLGVVMLSFALSACELEEDDPGQSKENKTRMSNYQYLSEQQPSHRMTYSPTRATKNFWIDTWNKRGKLAYVYLLNAQGDTIGYYVFEGLPVSYCTSLTPPVREYKIEGDSSGSRGELGPGPSIDGTFSSSANCNVFYGKDATTGGYMEYTTGQGINALVYDRPIPRFKEAQPLGRTEFSDVKK